MNKALRRLGGGKANVSASQRWKKQKTKKEDQTEEDREKAAKNSESFQRLTGEWTIRCEKVSCWLRDRKGDIRKATTFATYFLGLADELLSVGELEIYQETYEKLAFTVRQAEMKEESDKPQIPEGECL